MEPEQSGRRGCRYGCCGGYTRFGCRACCRPHDSSVAVAEKDEHVEGDDGYGYGYVGRDGYAFGWGGDGDSWGSGWGSGGGSWGSGGGSWSGGVGWGGGCRYGCCGRSYNGRCHRCCYSAAEAKAYDKNEAQP
ncbi:hypothetical protein HAX54_047480 [Datura stramonium]|uniref:Glycine-rich protein n=1 Tax=Datura stramonium TaxID=4076 RepID=A0ABS8SSX7_DATST|nr:hypothetical protein [Datura stramonium]